MEMKSGCAHSLVLLALVFITLYGLCLLMGE